MGLLSKLKSGLAKSAARLTKGTADIFKKKSPKPEATPHITPEAKPAPPPLSAKPPQPQRQPPAEPPTEPDAKTPAPAETPPQTPEVIPTEPDASPPPPKEPPPEEPTPEPSKHSMEQLLLSTDLGVATTDQLLKAIAKAQNPKECLGIIRQNLNKMLKGSAIALPFSNPPTKPLAVMFCGNNGCGKTTTIGKFAAYLKPQKVVLAAADTFRAAATEQLEAWAHKTSALFVKGKQGGDAAAVAYEGYQLAVAEQADFLLVDTAGRQHTNQNLMAELAKLKTVLTKLNPECLSVLVIDGTTGMNAISAATEFKQVLDPYCLIVTKLDTEAKGGAVVNLWQKLKLPIAAVGLGEGETDWSEFDPTHFTAALLGQ